MTYTDINKFYNVQLDTYTAELQETYKQLHADDETKKFLEWWVGIPNSMVELKNFFIEILFGFILWLFFRFLMALKCDLGQQLEAVRLFYNYFTPFPHRY